MCNGKYGNNILNLIEKKECLFVFFQRNNGGSFCTMWEFYNGTKSIKTS
jgi:hypothetical protein